MFDNTTKQINESRKQVRVSQVDCRCRLLIVPLFRGSSRFESLILSHLSRFTCECNEEDINDDDESTCPEAHDFSEFNVSGQRNHLDDNVDSDQ